MTHHNTLPISAVFLSLLLLAGNGFGMLVDFTIPEKCDACALSGTNLPNSNVNRSKQCDCETIDTLRSEFVYRIMYNQHIWCKDSNCLYYIIGGVGASIHQNLDVNDNKSIELLVEDDKNINHLFEKMCHDIQHYYYYNYGKHPIRISSLPVSLIPSEKKYLFSKYGKITLFYDSQPIASVKLLVSSDKIKGIKPDFLNIPFQFAGGVQKKIPVYIINKKGYATLDISYLNNEWKNIQSIKNCSHETIRSHIPKAIDISERLAEIKRRFSLYESSFYEPGGAENYTMVTHIFNKSLSAFKEAPLLLPNLRHSAMIFNYQMDLRVGEDCFYGGPADYSLSNEEKHQLAFKKLNIILAKDFMVDNVLPDGNCFYQSVANVLNSSDEIRGSFLNAVFNLIPNHHQIYSNSTIDVALVRVFIHQWIVTMKQIPGISNDEITSFLDSYGTLNEALRGNYIKMLPPRDDASNDNHWGWMDLLYPIALSIGRPIVVLSPDIEKKQINSFIYSAAGLEELLPNVVNKLRQYPQLLCPQQKTGINHMLAVASTHYSRHINSCHPMPALGKRLRPLIQAAELLMHMEPLPDIQLPSPLQNNNMLSSSLQPLEAVLTESSNPEVINATIPNQTETVDFTRLSPLTVVNQRPYAYNVPHSAPAGSGNPQPEANGFGVTAFPPLPHAPLTYNPSFMEAPHKKKKKRRKSSKIPIGAIDVRELERELVQQTQPETRETQTKQINDVFPLEKKDEQLRSKWLAKSEEQDAGGKSAETAVETESVKKQKKRRKKKKPQDSLSTVLPEQAAPCGGTEQTTGTAKTTDTETAASTAAQNNCTPLSGDALNTVDTPFYQAMNNPEISKAEKAPTQPALIHNERLNGNPPSNKASKKSTAQRATRKNVTFGETVYDSEGGERTLQTAAKNTMQKTVSSTTSQAKPAVKIVPPSPTHDKLINTLNEITEKLSRFQKAGIELKPNVKKGYGEELFNVIYQHITVQKPTGKSETESSDCKLVDLDRCSGDTLDALQISDDYGHPLAPIILGMYKMRKAGSEPLMTEEVLEVIQLFQRAAMRETIQGPMFLYWLAEVTGSPEALSASLQTIQRVDPTKKENLPELRFLMDRQHAAEGISSEDAALIPARLNRMVAQQKHGVFTSEDKLFLENLYPVTAELQGLLTPDVLLKTGLEFNEKEMANTMLHASHMGFFYRRTGCVTKAVEHFMSASIAYSLLARKQYSFANITKASGLAALYQSFAFLGNSSLFSGIAVPVSLQSWKPSFPVLREVLKYTSRNHFLYAALASRMMIKYVRPATKQLERKIDYITIRNLDKDWAGNVFFEEEISQRLASLSGLIPEDSQHPKKPLSVRNEETQKLINNLSSQTIEKSDIHNTKTVISNSGVKGKKLPRAINGQRAITLINVNRKKLDEIKDQFNAILDPSFNLISELARDVQEKINGRVLYDKHHANILYFCHEIENVLQAYDFISLRNSINEKYHKRLLETHLNNILHRGLLLCQLMNYIDVLKKCDLFIPHFLGLIYSYAKDNEVMQEKNKKYSKLTGGKKEEIMIKKTNEKQIKFTYKTFEEEFRDSMIYLLDVDNYSDMNEELALLLVDTMALGFEIFPRDLSSEQRNDVVKVIDNALHYMNNCNDLFLLFDLFLKIGVTDNEKELDVFLAVLYKLWSNISISMDYDDQEQYYHAIIEDVNKLENCPQRQSIVQVCNETLRWRDVDRKALFEEKEVEAAAMWSKLQQEENDKVNQAIAQRKEAEAKLLKVYRAEISGESEQEEDDDDDDTLWVINDTPLAAEVLAGEAEGGDELLFQYSPQRKVTKQANQQLPTGNGGADANQPDSDVVHVRNIEPEDRGIHKETARERTVKNKLYEIIKLAQKKQYEHAISELSILLENNKSDSLLSARISMLKSEYLLEMIQVKQPLFNKAELNILYSRVKGFAHEYASAKKAKTAAVTIPYIPKDDLWKVYSKVVELGEDIDSDEHLLNQAVDEQANAIRILNLFLQDADTERQDLSIVQFEFQILVTAYCYSNLILTRIDEMSNCIKQTVQDRSELINKKKMQTQAKLALAYRDRSGSSLSLRNRQRGIGVGGGSIVPRGTRNICQEQDHGPDLRVKVVRERLQRVKQAVAKVQKKLPNSTRMEELKLLLLLQ